MLAFLSILHIIVAVALIGLVLLQDSKGGAMGVFGGGSSQSVFGATGGTNVLVKLTRAAAILFSITCIYLAYTTSSNQSGSVLDKATIPTTQSAPVETGLQETAPATDSTATQQDSANQ
ncbi:MAG: preprotein translocase subunit SecG [Bdellovibrionaceae bacterium]|nr:preprotein translocase subunit SecG [Pseudobdellovibrionaceae bacterium]|tara:strand:- start:228 stop:584 length:357 start_codon:yes stop_codon:yes gene_type:complete